MSFLINPFTFAGVQELARDTTAYEDLVNRTTYTSDARSIGAASTTRRVYYLLRAQGSANGRTLSSATIGGVAATIEKQVTRDLVVVAIISATVPTGTTAAVVATYSAGMLNFHASVIALDSLVSTTPTDSASGSAANPPASVDTGANQDFPSAGYVMGVAGADGDSGTGDIAWTNLTETVDVFENGENLWFGVAYQSVGSAVASGVTITATFSFTGDVGDMVIATISVR